MVDEPFKQPNCCGSMLFLTSEIIHWTTKSSSTLERHAVSDIGLVSAPLVGCLAFGMGVICESFHTVGTIPDESDVLKMFATSSVNK